jgi:putative ABC transport system permease protein
MTPVPDSRWTRDVRRVLAPLHLDPAREADIAQELAAHLQDRYAELLASGIDPAQAGREALAELDDRDLVRGLIGIDTRAIEPLPLGGGSARSWTSGLWLDLRFGARLFVKERGATFVVVLTLALAIAANGIVFGLADLLLFRPLPLGNATRLATIYGVGPEHSVDRQRLSMADYLDIKTQSTVFEDVIGMRRGQQLTLTGAGEATAVSAAFVTANTFSVWDVHAIAGRTILPDEGAPGRIGVAVLSHRFWAAHFAGDRSIVNRTVMLNGRSHTIVGVLTPEIELGNLSEIDVWVPLEIDRAAPRDDRTLTAMGLLAPGATLGAANAELGTIGDRIAAAHPETNNGWRLHAITLRESVAGAQTWVILMLLGIVVGLVLVVACANVATVMLARASARRREMAVRLALGASRGRLVRQLISEALLIGFASGAAGLLLAQAGLTAFKTLSPEVLFQRLTVNANLLVFGVVLSIAAPILFGVLPALQSSRPNLNEDLKEGGRDSAVSVRGNRIRAALVVTQVAFALSVLIVSGLIVRTVVSLEHVPLGMNPEGVLTTRVRFDPPRYTGDAARLRAVDAILERITALPGVATAAAMPSLPIVDGEPRRLFAITDQPVPDRRNMPWANAAAASDEYWRTFGVPLVEGRSWTAGDQSRAWAVAVVNREAARRYWPSRSPIGDRITMIGASGQPEGSALEIIGIVDNVLGNELSDPPPPRLYRPLAVASNLASVAFAVRVTGDTAAMASAIREALRAEDRDLAASELRPARRVLDETTRTYNLVMALFVGFAAIGLVVAVTGVYGVTAFSVGQRRHEIGVRLALGATGADVLRLIGGRTARLIAAGAALGVAGGWSIAAAMRSILFGVGALDPLTYAAVLTLVTTCGLAATYLPAHRALSIDPVSVLKRE